jgi:hypothetical protein
MPGDVPIGRRCFVKVDGAEEAGRPGEVLSNALPQGFGSRERRDRGEFLFGVPNSVFRNVLARARDRLLDAIGFLRIQQSAPERHAGFFELRWKRPGCAIDPGKRVHRRTLPDCVSGIDEDR